MPRQFSILFNLLFLFWSVGALGQSQSQANKGLRSSEGRSIVLKKGDEDKLLMLCDRSHGITKLVLKDLQTATLPTCLFENSQLVELQLIGASWISIPTEVQQLEKLEVLEISNSMLHELPIWLGKIPSLHTLILKSTSIRELPSGLENLSKIDLRYNEFTRKEQQFIRAQYPKIKIFFSSPCHCN